MTSTYYFAQEDFKLQVPANSNANDCLLSQFDKEYQAIWAEHMDKGHFNYTFHGHSNDDVKVLEGKYGFIAQHIPNRVTNRRPPQSMMHLKQDFCHDKFHFNKIVEENEVLFQLKNGTSKGVDNGHRDLVIINASPYEYGSCLLLPSVESCLPQIVTKHSVEVALWVVLLSGVKNFKAFFNSLCAFASVNHQHWHLYYLQRHSLLLETLPMRKLAGPCYEITPDTYPAPGFAFQLNDFSFASIARLAESVAKVTDLLVQQDVAHNLMVTRGTSFQKMTATPETPAAKKSLDTLRVFVWAREKIVGVKKADDIGMAAAELAGHVLTYDAESFETLTEDMVARAQAKACKDQFERVRPMVRKLFEQELA